MEKTQYAVAEKRRLGASPFAPARRDALEALRRQVRALEGGRVSVGAVSLGAGVDLVGGDLAWGSVHEAQGAAYLDGPAAAGFALFACARALRGHPGALVWVGGDGAFDFGSPYGPGCAGCGLDPGRVLFVRGANATENLAALEEAARTRGIAAVTGALGPAVPDAAGRRLRLAAEAGGALVMIWRPAGAAGLSGARSRWRVSARASAPPEWAEATGLGARTPPGRSALRLTRLKGRGEGLCVDVEWRNAADGFLAYPALADRAPVGTARVA